MPTEDNGSRKPVSIVAIGAGNRANKYLHYIFQNPDKVKLVGVVEINPLRREAVAKKAGLDASQCYSSYDDFFASEKRADAVIISTPDDEHYRPCMMAIEQGYHVLLEKPIAQTLEECEQIAEAAKRKGVIVEICYVLHFHPYFIKLKELVQSGKYGKIMSISHKAPVGIDRMSHIYVRGIWNKKSTSGPVLTSKCCHDLDFLTWITKSRCRKVSSFGGLSWFSKENAPAGSGERCVVCGAESSCPFSAINLYKERRDWITNFDVPEGRTFDEVIDEELRNGDYGKCVYRCDNDVADHQVLIMQMDNDITIDFTMDVFTQSNIRTTHIGLTEGEIFGDETSITATHYRSRKTESFDFSKIHGTPFHAGADLNTIADFVNVVANQGKVPSTDIYDAIESHRICSAAEVSRLSGQTVTLK